MAKREVLGLYSDANYAAEAGDALQEIGLSNEDYDFLTGAPYPEGAFGERHISHRLYVFPFVGALCGLTAGILLTSMTQMAYPLVTGRKAHPLAAPHGDRHLRGHHAGGDTVHRPGHSFRVPGSPASAGGCTTTESQRGSSGSW